MSPAPLDSRAALKTTDKCHRGVLDFNPINTIASHMSYWADEDVNHFMMSQILSKRLRDKRE